jgi:hypothetical protein
MVVNDDAGCLDTCGVRAFFASGLAPTVIFGRPLVWRIAIEHVGATLARDGGVSGVMDVGCAGLIAGKPCSYS